MSKPPHRLDALMNARRLQLGMDWQDVADVARIRTQTLRVVRQGGNEPSDKTKYGLEVALRWEPGSVDAVLGGGDPTPTEGQAEQAVADPAAAQAEAAAALLRALPPDVQRRTLEIYEELRRQAHSTPERDAG